MAGTIADLVVQLPADMSEAVSELKNSWAAFLGLGKSMEDAADHETAALVLRNTYRS
jgi:hypothetical protein